MTCIAGLVHGGKVYIGGDSAATERYNFSQTIRSDKKVFRVGEMLIGTSGSPRMSQLLAYGLTVPQHHADVDTYTYMVTSFMAAVRESQRSGGALKVTESVEHLAGYFLVGYKRRLFAVYTDFQVEEADDGYNAVGSGAEIALGSLFTTSGTIQDPGARIHMALRGAEHHNAGVRAPFHIEILE